MIKLLSLSKVWFLLLLLPLTTTAAPIPVQHSFSDRITNEALFELYQGHYFPAINHLITARKNNSLTSDDDEYELILAGLYISFGLDDEAEKIFKERLSKSNHRKLRNQAMLLIAKLQFRHGLYEKAEKTLKKVQVQLTPEQQEERLILHGQLLSLRNKHRWSVARLRKINNNSEWAIYGRYNLAITLIKLKDALAGQVLLEAIGQIEATTEDMRALRDRANLALGFWFLENKQSEDALQVLKRIRLNSPATSMGLLGVGWAYEQQGEYMAAISTWQHLFKKGVSDTAVHEAKLTTAYAYLGLESNQMALSSFEEAIQHYNREITQLDTNITALKSGAFFNSSETDQVQLGKAWLNWAFVQSVNPSHNALSSILKSHIFISSLNDLRDLLFLNHSLKLWSSELNTFKGFLGKSPKKSVEKMLTALTKESNRLLQKQQKYNQLSSRAQQPSSRLDLSTSSHLYSYRKILFDIDIMSKNRHAATGTERLMLKNRQSNLSIIKHFTKEDKNSQKRYDTLEKIIQWQGEKTFEESLSPAQNALTDINMKLGIVEKRKQAMLMLQQAEESDIRANDKLINKSLSKIKTLQPKLNSTISKQIAHLTELTTHELTTQKQRLKGYLIRAHYSVARIHDKALGSKERSW